MLVHPAALLSTKLSAAERARLAHEARHTVGIGIGATHALAHFGDPEAADRFAVRYPDLRTAAASPVRTYAVRNGAATYFWVDDGEEFVWPHGPLTERLIAFLADAVTTHALLSAIPSAVSLHAAALRRHDVAFAITGASEAGKSTTAVACVASGCALYSDERCIATPDGVLAYPRTVNIRALGLALLCDALPESALRERLRARLPGPWENVRIAELTGCGALPTPAPLRALFAIAGRDAAPSSRRIAAAQMLGLAEPGAKVAAHGIERVRAILTFLQSVACYELVLGDPLATAAHIIERVEAER